MPENQLREKSLKIASDLEKRRTIEDCCEVAKELYGKHEQICGSDLYYYFYRGLLVTYIEDKEVNNIESGKSIDVRFKTFGEVVLNGKREERGNGYQPIINSEYGRFCILTYLPKGRWEGIVKKVKKRKIPSEEIINQEKEINLIQDFRKNFGR